jgi:hypothetical protein
LIIVTGLRAGGRAAGLNVGEAADETAAVSTAKNGGGAVSV